MSPIGFDNNTRSQLPVTHHAPSFHRGTRQEGQDDGGSVSGSDDGSYTMYHDIVKGELDGEDDHSALTSQTLNTDGTPKRPMNAFMIFARRRRPQVSAENQAMRTGEISKILSKEWNSMQLVEKQFYQDQARQLKDTFNTKYPDYVYRRRPNHSRRKRKPDMTELFPSDSHSPSDTRDDTGFDDVGDWSIEGEDLHAHQGMSDLHRRPSHDVHAYSEYPKFHQAPSRGSPYAHQMYEHPLRSNGLHEKRLSFDSSGSGDRIFPESPAGQPPPSLPYSYMAVQGQNRTQTQAIPIYGQNPVGSDDWNLPSARPSSWLGPSEQSDRPFASHTLPKVHVSSTSPTWQRSSHSANSSSSAPLSLPTLNSPFFPGDSTQESLSPSQTQSVPPSSYSSGLMQPPQLVGQDFDNSGLSLSLSMSNPPHPYYSNAGRDGMAYATREPEMPHSLPSISNYSQSQPSQFSTNAGLGGPQAYWPGG